ncbi:MAG: hypothetical protein AAFX44_13750 [Pseudomonadota bacterium]
MTEIGCACRVWLVSFSIALLGAIAPTAPAEGADRPWTDLADNARWSLDLATRRTEALDGPGWSGNYAVGLDLQKVLSGGGRDLGVIVFQPYFVRLINVDQPSLTFDDPSEWELTWRIANANFHVLERGRLNLRFGHFELPFGLEQNIDTNGTLRQLTFAERGIKVDWGVTANGIVNQLEYELALSRGSGNDFEAIGDPYVVAGRVGSSTRRNVIVGASFLAGDVLTTNGTADRRRLGLDLAMYRDNWEWLIELSSGEDDGQDRHLVFSDVAWRSPLETVLVYLQSRYSRGERLEGDVDARSAALGCAVTLRRRWSVSAEFRRTVTDDPLQRDDVTATVQIRFRTAG